MKTHNYPNFPLFLGCATFGSAIPENDAFALMDYFWEQGGRAFDTAHIYAAWLPNGTGASERCLGKWLQSRGVRDEAYILTKGGHPLLADMKPRLREETLRQDLEESLERLQVNFFDQYVLHRDNLTYSTHDIINWLEEIVSEEKCLAYGCSNWLLPRIKEAQNYAKENNYQGFACSSLGYSLAECNPGFGENFEMRFMDDEHHQYHQETELAQIPYSSQALGFFQERYAQGWDTPKELRKDEVVERYFSNKNFSKLDSCLKLAQEKNCSPNQIALAYLLQQRFPCYPIIGGRNKAQIIDSCKATEVQFTEKEYVLLT